MCTLWLNTEISISKQGQNNQTFFVAQYVDSRWMYLINISQTSVSL